MMKPFSREKLIKEIVGELLFPMNFTFRGNSKRRYWVFSRKKDDVTQIIELVERLGGGPIMLRYRSSLHYYPKDITGLFEEQGITLETWSCDDAISGWSYTDKDSFIRVLTIFRNLIETYVLEELEKMSIFDSEVRITTKNLDYLRENRDEILKVQAKNYGLEGLNLDEKVNVLSEKIADLKGRPFSVVEKELLHIGILYGGMIIEEYGGHWKWNDLFNNILVDSIAKRFITSLPIYAVFEEWEGKETIKQDLLRIREEIATKELIPRNLQKYCIK